MRQTHSYGGRPMKTFSRWYLFFFGAYMRPAARV
jgi:hypothetical protein